MRAPTAEEATMMRELMFFDSVDVDNVLDDAKEEVANRLVMLGWARRTSGWEDHPDDDELEEEWEYWSVTPDGELALRLAALVDR